MAIKSTTAPIKLNRKIGVKKLLPKKAALAASNVPTAAIRTTPKSESKPEEASVIKIVTNKKFGGLGEIYQSKAVKFALLRDLGDKTCEQITPFVQCRDFIGDVFTSTHQKADFGIYGMSWSGTKESPDMEVLRLVVKFPDSESQTSFEKNISILHEIEGKNNIPRTEYIHNKSKQGIIFANKRWLTNVLYVSLYTFLLRVFCYKLTTNDWVTELGSQSFSDSNYVKSIAKETWEKVLGNLSLIDTPEFCAMDIKKEMSNVHHNAGFISTFGSHSEINYSAVKKNPHYKQMISNGVFVEKRF